MNNSPGWASPGSSPSDEPDRGPQEQSSPADRPGPSGQQPPSQWSTQQPPSGQWSAPTGPGPGQDAPGPQSGWGGGPGWGTPWAPPPAAKPGVIPLRPLGIGEILDGAVSTMRAHWRTVLGISLVVAVFTQTVNTLVSGLFLDDAVRMSSLENNPDVALSEALSQMSTALLSSGIAWLISMLGVVVVTGLLTIVVSRAVLGRSVTTGEAWRDARGQLPRLLGLLFLVPLMIVAIMAVCMAPGLLVASTGGAAAVGTGALLVGLGGLAAAVVGVWLWIRFCLAAPALMLEKQGVLTAMRRSAKLVRGSWWRVLGVQLLTVVLTMLIQFIVQIPAALIAVLVSGQSFMDLAEGTGGTGWTFLIVSGIGAVISSTIAFPISAGVTSLLYMDQRIRREALDLELARAAGLPGYGSDPQGAAGSPAAPQQPTDPAPES